MKTEYTPAFESFWKAYPRRTAKAPAFKAWKKNVDEDDAFMVKAIVADCEKRTRMKWWPFDSTKIPHAATWLNAQRYLDEGWELDIKTRGQEQKGASYTPREPTVMAPGHEQGSWYSMLNRLGRNYLMACMGLPDQMAAQLQATLKEVHAEMMGAVNEEIDAAAEGDKPKVKGEMAYLLADTMLTRFDMLTGRKLKGTIMNVTKRAA